MSIFLESVHFGQNPSDPLFELTCFLNDRLTYITDTAYCYLKNVLFIMGLYCFSMGLLLLIMGLL